jgi:hypothetical protein
MTYKRGQFSISIYQLDGFGKKPSLWIGDDESNQMVKVASFCGKDEADTFCKWLEYLLRLSNDEKAVKLDD